MPLVVGRHRRRAESERDFVQALGAERVWNASLCTEAHACWRTGTGASSAQSTPCANTPMPRALPRHLMMVASGWVFRSALRMPSALGR